MQPLHLGSRVQGARTLALPLLPSFCPGSTRAWACAVLSASCPDTLSQPSLPCCSLPPTHTITRTHAATTPCPLPFVQVADVIGTFRMLSQLPNDSLGAYIISMSHTASDVLAVVLLQKECGGVRGGARNTGGSP